MVRAALGDLDIGRIEGRGGHAWRGVVVEVVGQADLVLSSPFEMLVEQRDDARCVGGAHEEINFGQLLFQLLAVALGHAAADDQQLALAVLLAAYITSIAALTFSLYEQPMRAMNVSLAFNIAYGVIGGTTPMLAVWLNSHMAYQLAFAWYLTFLCCASAVALLTLKPIRMA